MKNKESVLKYLGLGVFGASLLAISGWLTGALGKGNTKNGLIMTNWAKIPAWRFETAIIIAAIGVILLGLGMNYMSHVIKLIRRRRVPLDSKAALITSLGTLCTSVSAFFIIAINNIIPLLYKELYESSLMEADMMDAVEGIFYYVSIPFFFFYAISIITVSIGFIYFILCERLRISKIYLILNPLVFYGIKKILAYITIIQVADFASGMVALGYAFMLMGMISGTAKIPAKKKQVR